MYILYYILYIDHELKSISYPENKNECHFSIGESINLKPIIDDVKDVEYIKIEISVTATEGCDETFEIEVGNIHNSITLEIHLVIK